MRLPLDVTLESKEEGKISTSAADYLLKLKSKLHVLDKVAQENIESKQKQYKEYFDRKASEPNFYLSQRVWLHNPKVPVGKSSKFHNKWTGPYYISDIGPNHTYMLRDCSTHKLQRALVHANRLKIFSDPALREQHNLNEKKERGHGDLRLAPDWKVEPSQEEDPVRPTESPSHGSDQLELLRDPSRESVLNWGIFDKLLACARHQGKKVYKVKWQDCSKTTWEPAENLPDFLIRDFHVNRTLKGKVQKSNKRS
ncbi:hypothetical protein ACJMK2_000206 [Sinanodonta woodiana]|uniref:Chromo domain-containing protein n=1 Tax=Sinanodonta woodiana TaxID=1069815 RepID=A0ABD3XS06_SINWO